VISNHLENEERFRTPELLVEHGVRRAMNVILQGDGTPFGVLEVDSRSEGEFHEHDIAFLQGAANLLGMAIERQRIERDLRMALDQREILLQEVNHRVKNSLQLVASMLHLQASAAEGEETRQQLHEASSRISAIARAHQRLYRSNQVSTVDLAAYLVDVCDDLNLTNTDCTVEVQVPEPIEIATDRAIPLALVVNELVTNAIKYAYPDTQRCRVLVSLRRADDDGIVLSIEDEGVGLPAGFAVTSSKGLGMRIVAAFAQQLGADLQVRPRDPGTAFVLLLPLGTNGKGG
jgi:two-component sensor histidine kinase